MSLLLHELTTNALTYGALSKPGGNVALTWQVAGDEMTVHWRGSGGPAVVDPTRRGFGSGLIKMGLIGTGGVQLRYLPAGSRPRFHRRAVPVAANMTGAHTTMPANRQIVLVVEDEPLLRMTAVDMVEEAGFEALEADATQAVEILEKRLDIAQGHRWYEASYPHP